MKNALAVTGVAIVIAMLLSSPTFAQTSNSQPVGAAGTPVPIIAETLPAETPSLDTPLDELIEGASTQEDSAKLRLRCVGPPARAIASAEDGKKAPGRIPLS